MAYPLETFIQNGFMSVLGDPTLGGVAVIGFLTGMVLLLPTHPAVKVIGIFGGVILSLSCGLTWAMLLLSLGLGIILWFAMRRIWG